MRICFLGSSHGVPEPGRQCSSTMIDVSGRIYLIDMGMMVIPALINRGIPIDAVKGVFVTHMHGDHTNGLPGFVDLLTWYFKTADPAILLPKQEAVAVLADWTRLIGAGNRELRYGTVLPGTVYDDGYLKVTAIATKHCDRSYAFLIEAENKRLLFTGDLHRTLEDFPEVAKQQALDLLVCEAAHFPPTQYLPIFRQCSIKTICINHHAPRHMAAMQQLMADMGSNTVIAAHDGLELQL